MVIIACLTLVIAVPLALVTGFFGLELLVGLKALPIARLVGSRPMKKAIIVPAHNEERTIAATIGSLLAQTAGDFDILVVAHNCLDRTAVLARAAGARVLVCDQPQQRGKGYALTAGANALRDDPPDVVVVVDADCRIDRTSLELISFVAETSQRPAQAVYLLTGRDNASELVSLSNFAFMVKNLIRQRALQRLARRAHLTGTGMAFPWRVFESANLGASNLVEDLALGLELASQGLPATLVDRALIVSRSASTAGTVAQRQRWEGGYLSSMRLVPKLFIRAIFQGQVRDIWAALDLSIPPLALLAIFDLLALLIAVMAAMTGASPAAALILLSSGVFAFLALTIAWSVEGRRFVTASALLRLPIYIFWKLPIYLSFIRRGAPKEWLRTERPD